MDRVRQESEQVKHSVTQLRVQLDQVQIQARTAREDLEAKLKTSDEQLSKAQEDLARERTARESAEKAAQQAQADAARERDARAAAEAAARTRLPRAGAICSGSRYASSGTLITVKLVRPIDLILIGAIADWLAGDGTARLRVPARFAA